MTPTDRPQDDRFVLHVRDLTSLRREARFVDQDALASSVLVEIDACATSPSLVSNPAWPRLVRLSIEARGDGVNLEAQFDAPAPVAEVVAAVARSVVPGRLDPAGWPATATGPAARSWKPDADFPPDLVVTDEPLSLDDVPDPHPVLTRPPVVVVTGPEPTWADFEDGATPGAPIDLGPLDERLLNPVGFKRQHRQPVAHLVAHEDVDRLELRTAKGKVLLDARHGPSEQDIDGLRRLAAVHLSWEGTRGPRAYARVVAGLAMAGVPLVGDTVPDWATALLHPELAQALTRGVSTGSTTEGRVSTGSTTEGGVSTTSISTTSSSARRTASGSAGPRSPITPPPVGAGPPVWRTACRPCPRPRSRCSCRPGGRSRCRSRSGRSRASAGSTWSSSW